VHAFSQTAREKIEAAGGTATAFREPTDKKRTKKKKKARETDETAAAETTAAAKGARGEPDEGVDAEPTDREAIAESVEQAPDAEAEE
ncbi:MAG: uL15 family ribosomal protein, partial [Actinobacteria bacterium]|nr:uL15 family ribosomal protein [Actinomycetota bacterium]